MVDWAKTGVEIIASKFDAPDADFAPMCLMLTPEHNEIVGLPYEMLGTKKGRYQLVHQVIPDTIRNAKATAVALVMPVWQVRREQVDKPLELIERDHGDDGVLIHAVVSDATVWMVARLKRRKTKPPKLGKWITPPTDSPPGETTELMQQALRDVQSLN